jgi:DNA-directed RNA polymerase subunit omega
VERIETLESKFRFVHAAARRARQLQAGSQAMMTSPSRKPTRVAMEELLTGAVTFEDQAENSPRAGS